MGAVCRMGSATTLLSLSLALALAVSVLSSVVSRPGSRASQPRQKLSQRERKCSGEEQEIYLSQGKPVVVQPEGTETGEFVPNCKQIWTVLLDRDDQDLGQWRIKVEVEELSLDCQAAQLTLLEEGRPKQELCGTRQKSVYYSHEHMVKLKYKTGECGPGGCHNTRVRLSVTAQYVCGGTFTADHGYIASPFFPNNYIDSETCLYDIQAPKKKRIALTCDYFNLDPKCDGRCSANGEKDFFQDIMTFKRYEGKQLQNKTLKSKNNHHTLYFLSNGHNIEKDKHQYGFNCTYNFF